MIENTIAMLRSDRRSLIFRGFDRIAEDIMVLCTQSRNGSVMAVYEDDNPPVILVSLDLPVEFKGTCYPVPMKMCFFHEYPVDPPYCRVITLNEKQHFRNKHECLDPSDGTIVNLPSLVNWKATTSILQVINEIRVRFEKNFPIREGQKPQPGSNDQIEYEMRQVLRERLEDTRRIMENRISDETNKLQTLDNELSQQINLAERAQEEKNRDMNTLGSCLADLEERNKKMRQFLSEHPQNDVSPENVMGIAMPKGNNDLLDMIELRAKLEAFDNTVKMLENLPASNIAKDVVETVIKDFYGTSVAHFQNVYKLQILLNQHPEYRKFFV